MQLCGILNYTPDSFSDGNQYNLLDAAIARCNQLFSEGADIVDIGAQSTSYFANQIPAQNEWEHLEPLLRNLTDLQKISVDSYNFDTARKAVDMGIGYINDVKGGQTTKMLDLIAANPKLKYICMFSLCIPADKNIRIKDVWEVYNWCDQMVLKLKSHGINEEQIILDPGIGFATSTEQSYYVIKHCGQLKQYGVKIMIGHSRKSYLEAITHLPAYERDIETLTASLYMYNKVDYLRVHNIQMHKRAFGLWGKLIPFSAL